MFMKILPTFGSFQTINFLKLLQLTVNDVTFSAETRHDAGRPCRIFCVLENRKMAKLFVTIKSKMQMCAE